jgi:CrcB protein
VSGYLAVGAGGALGAMARFWLSAWILDRLGTALPWGTIAINVSGSFAIGVLGTLALDTDWITVPQREFLIIGILGGFTTYSTFSFEFQRYVQAGDIRPALAYFVLTVIPALVAVFLGAAVARAVH